MKMFSNAVELYIANSQCSRPNDEKRIESIHAPKNVSVYIYSRILEKHVRASKWEPNKKPADVGKIPGKIVKMSTRPNMQIVSLAAHSSRRRTRTKDPAKRNAMG